MDIKLISKWGFIESHSMSLNQFSIKFYVSKKMLKSYPGSKNSLEHFHDGYELQSHVSANSKASFQFSSSNKLLTMNLKAFL